MTPLQLSLNIEAAFRKFQYSLSFDRSSIENHPAKSIQEGLVWLESIGAISTEERRNHISNFEWGNAKLCEVMNDSTCMQNIDALLRNIDYWYKRYQEKL